MNQRIILKTIIICVGIFLILGVSIAYYIYKNFEFDIEPKYQVIVASTDIDVGTEINESMVGYRTIKESAWNKYMFTEMKDVVGKKTLVKTLVGDYISEYNVLPKELWFNDDDRAITLLMDVEDRMANLIQKGSIIDIKVSFNEIATTPKRVLSKIRIAEILDENGISINDNTIGGRKAYAKFILSSEQRDKLYVAKKFGKFIFELYCDTTQIKPEDEFKIPPEYFEQGILFEPTSDQNNLTTQTQTGTQSNQNLQGSNEATNSGQQ